MKTLFFNNQIMMAKNNFNYFFMKMIVKIFQNIFKIASILLISQICNLLFVNILSILLIITTIYNIYEIVTNYSQILKDIKNTLPNENICYEIDLNTLSNNLFRIGERYGR